MNAPHATPKQIGTIHGLAAKAGMDEETRRDFLARETGHRSCKEISAAQADRVIDTLRELGAGRGAVRGLDTPVARKLRALWIAGWCLGLVRDRTDRAMLSFLERQTGVTHTRFLVDAGAGAAAIEGLKRWLARDGGVKWPADASPQARKRAVLEAQWLKLVELGEVKPFIQSRPLGELPDYAFRVASRNGWQHFEPQHYDIVMQALGRKLRGALARKAEAAKAGAA